MRPSPRSSSAPRSRAGRGAGTRVSSCGSTISMLCSSDVSGAARGPEQRLPRAEADERHRLRPGMDQHGQRAEHGVEAAVGQLALPDAVHVDDAHRALVLDAPTAPSRLPRTRCPRCARRGGAPRASPLSGARRRVTRTTHRRRQRGHACRARPEAPRHRAGQEDHGQDDEQPQGAARCRCTSSSTTPVTIEPSVEPAMFAACSQPDPAPQPGEVGLDRPLQEREAEAHHQRRRADEEHRAART